MNINKININQSEQTYNIASDIYDVTTNNNDASFESLSALLSDENLSTLIPSAVRCGGMTIRFVQSSDNKYVQYRLMSAAWSTVVDDWQGVDDVPTVGSDNLVKSGGVADVIETNTQSINTLKERTNEISMVVAEDKNEEIIIEDNSGNVIATLNEEGADFIKLKQGGVDVGAAITDETERATAADEANTNAINTLKERINEISRVVVEDESEEIIIEDNDGNVVATINKDGLDVSEIKTGKLVLSNDINHYTDIEISSDDNITIEDGRCCSFIEGGSYLIKGTRNATINVSFVKKTFKDVSYGFMWSWNSQQIASLSAQGVKIGMYDGSYNIQGGSFQRINKHDSSVDAIFEVSSTSDDTWSLLITKRAEKFTKPRVKPICIVYDGGRWQGQVYWEGELYKIWDLHRKLDIPYAVALFSYQMNPEAGEEYTCEEVRRDIESGLCEVIVRNATAMVKETDLEYLEAMKSERSLLEVRSKATILAAHHLTTLIHRCSIKDGADFIRQYPFNDTHGMIAYKYSDTPYKVIHSTGIPITLNESDNFWLPQIFWAHGVGIPPEGDIYSSMYGDSTGVNTQVGFRNILSLAASGKVQILHPSDFSQYCKNIK